MVRSKRHEMLVIFEKAKKEIKKNAQRNPFVRKRIREHPKRRRLTRSGYIDRILSVDMNKEEPYERE